MIVTWDRGGELPGDHHYSGLFNRFQELSIVTNVICFSAGWKNGLEAAIVRVRVGFPIKGHSEGNEGLASGGEPRAGEEANMMALVVSVLVMVIKKQRDLTSFYSTLCEIAWRDRRRHRHGGEGGGALFLRKGQPRVDERTDWSFHFSSFSFDSSSLASRK